MSDASLAPASTNPCGSGGAHPLPGFSLSIFAGAPAIEALLVKDMPRGAAAAVAGVIGGATWSLSAICSSNPPDDPVLTQADFDALNFPYDIVPYLTAVNRFKDAFVRVAWVNWCGCDNGSVPSLTTIAAPPDQSQNPGLPSGPSGSSCFFGSQQVQVNSSIQFIFNGAILMWDDGGVFLPAGTARELPVPAPSLVQLHLRYNPNPGDNIGVAGAILFFNSGGTLTGSVGFPVSPPPLDSTISMAPPTGSVSCTLQITSRVVGTGPAVATGSMLAECTMFCAGQGPGTPESPCCPPDPSVDARLNAILQIVGSLASNAIGPADSLTPGTVHSNLSGSGSVLLVAECAAIQVNVHAPLPPLEVNPGTPDYYFSMGFITSYAVGSPLKGWRLVYTQQIFPLQTYADQIGFTLPAGVTIDIVEQLPAAAVG